MIRKVSQVSCRTSWGQMWWDRFHMPTDLLEWLTEASWDGVLRVVPAVPHPGHRPSRQRHLMLGRDIELAVPARVVACQGVGRLERGRPPGSGNPAGSLKTGVMLNRWVPGGGSTGSRRSVGSHGRGAGLPGRDMGPRWCLVAGME